MGSFNHSMPLDKLLEGYVAAGDSAELGNIVVCGLSLDSRKTGKGDIFIALNGETVNGYNYINAAVEAGAVAVLCDAVYQEKAGGSVVPVIAVEDLAQQVGLLAHRFYVVPSEKISVCGITGTNGKTSCADFISQAITIEQPCGMMGTLGKGIYPELKETGYTTPDAVTCHEWLAELKEANVQQAVMEVSSHALVQGRVNGIHFDSAVFTNISRDHLDFHGSMESYIQAKTQLFHFPGLKNAIINSDDETGRSIVSTLPSGVNCIRYGTDEKYSPDVLATGITLDHNGLSMHVCCPWGSGTVKSPVLGMFNVSNLLAVLAVLLVQGVEFNDAVSRLAKLKSVPGRMQRFGGVGAPLVIVDFAHTPDALEQTLISLRQHTENKLWCVFGCGGDRDQGKRPMMGAVAEKNADYIVLTNDNPRSESPARIIKDIQAGISGNKTVIIEDDRHTAIYHAISHAKQNDVVLVAGKGHEDYQLIGNEKIPFSDIDEVKTILEACS